MRLLWRIALVLGASAGCTAPVEAPSPPGVVVEASLAAGSALPGDDLLVDVTVRNSSRTAYSVAGSAGRCVGVVEVVDARGGRVRFGDSRVCDTGAALHPLAPGAVMTDRPYVQGVPGGEYRVRAAVAIADHGLVWSAPVPLSVHAR